MGLEFKIKDNKMLFWRFGNMNSNKQYEIKNPTFNVPVKRGIWAFPYPHYDFFFCYYQFEKLLPKKLRYDNLEKNVEKYSEEEKTNFFTKRSDAVEKLIKKNPPKKFWYGGKFYSHILPNGEVESEWFLWDCVKEWAIVAKKSLYHHEKYSDQLIKCKYSCDHLEIFILNY